MGCCGGRCGGGCSSLRGVCVAGLGPGSRLIPTMGSVSRCCRDARSLSQASSVLCCGPSCHCILGLCACLLAWGLCRGRACLLLQGWVSVVAKNLSV